MIFDVLRSLSIFLWIYMYVSLRISFYKTDKREKKKRETWAVENDNLLLSKNTVFTIYKDTRVARRKENRRGTSKIKDNNVPQQNSFAIISFIFNSTFPHYFFH